jgi:hypothetical protein
MQHPGLEPETPTWQAGTLPNYANAAYAGALTRLSYMRTSTARKAGFEPATSRFMGQEGFEPSCTSYPFYTLSE